MVPQSPVVPVSTGDFGTSVRHPPRERIAHAFSDQQAREGVAALPYTDNLTPTDPASSITTTHSRAGGHGGPPLRGIFQRSQVQISKASPQRDARWDVEREGRETKVVPPSPVVPVCTGDFGTSARYPPRERIYKASNN